jgi:hypothetical protein
MFHGYQGARAGKGDPDRNFQRHFLVRRPLRFSAQGCEGLQDLGRGSTGISRTEFHLGVARGHGNRFVTAQQ